MLAQMVNEPFDRADWLAELKLDGARCIAFLGKETRLQGRSGADMTAKFPELHNLHHQVNQPCILDGEIACASYHALQRRIHKEKPLDISIARRQYPARYYAFDVLNVAGENTMKLPQKERKETLRSVMADSDQGIVLPWQLGNAVALFKKVQEGKLEGIIEKRLTSPYVEGKRVDWWLKVKTFQEGVFYVCGLTKGESSREDTFGSLILGEVIDGSWHYVGNVGSGFDQQQLSLLLGYFQTLEAESPFCSKVAVDRKVKLWTKPVVKCEVRFLERGSSGKLRHPSFRRLVK